MTGLSAWSDHRLVTALVDHDEEALAEVFRRHASAVAATARTVLGQSDVCEDIVAEVFLALWLKPGQFDPDRGPLRAFLRVKARGRSVDVLRSEVARRRREAFDARTSVSPGSPEDHEFLTAEAAERMHLALQTLADKEREPIELAFFAGMPYVAVALHLGLPEGTVKTRIRDGLRHVRSIYEAHMQAGDDTVHTLIADLGRP